MSVVLQKPKPEVTLDAALLEGVRTFTNGCNFTLQFEKRRRPPLLRYGCYGVHINLAQGAERLLMDWLGEGGNERELTDVSPETIIELQKRKPCPQCGGFTFSASY